MRWKTNVTPKVGDTRVVTKFLWWPKTIDAVTRWMETASYKQEYQSYSLPSEDYPVSRIGWIDMEWTDLNYEVKYV